eukprot:gene10275-2694_t
MFRKIVQHSKNTLKFKNYVKNSSQLDVRPTESIQLFNSEAQSISTDDIFADDQNVALFGIPGAFTPTCSTKHVPSFINYSNELKSKGFTNIVCISVNDPFVMKSWAEELGADKKITFISDPEGSFTKHIGAELDLTEKGFGVRSQRYSMIIEKGRVISVNQDQDGFQKTGAIRLLDQWYKHQVAKTL